MKKTVIATIVLLALLCGCGSGTVKNDVPAGDIAGAMAQAIGMDDRLSAVDANYVKGFFEVDPADFGDWCVMINAYGTSADEIGVFKAGAGGVKSARQTVEAYLQTRLDTWMDEYMPEEKPKLTGAKISTMGEYVCYCILSSEDCAKALEAFEDSLK